MSANAHAESAGGGALLPLLAFAGKRRRRREHRERGAGLPRDAHPPSAMIATTSAAPRPAIINPTRQLP